MSTKVTKWKIVQLSDIAHVVAGQSPDGKFYNQEGIGTPFLQGSAEFGAIHPICKLSTTHVTKIAPEGAILFSVRAPVGELNTADKAYCIGRGLAAIIGKEHVNRSFLHQLLVFNTPKFKLQSQGSTFEAITTEQLKSVKITIPSEVKDQNFIADVLAQVDTEIARAEALIAKHERIRAGLLHDLLARGVDKQGRLRSEETHEFKDSAIGRVPLEWEIRKLEKVASISSGITLNSKTGAKDGVEVPYLRVANVQDGYVDLTEVKTVTVSTAEFEKALLQKGDVLMNEGGDFDKLGRGTVWQGQIEPCLHQNHVFKVRPKAGVLVSEFLAYFSSSPYGKRFFVLSSKQSTNLASINSTQLKSFPVALPSFDEQMLIVGIIAKQNKVLTAESDKLNKLRRLKTGLMHDLLTPPQVADTTVLQAAEALSA